MKREGGGGYANGLQDKKKTKKQLTGLKLAVAWEARAQGLRRIERRELDETFFCCCLLECGLILLLFCSHGQAKKKNAQEVWCR